MVPPNMRPLRRFVKLIAALTLAWLGMPDVVCAQTGGIGMAPAMPSMGALASPMGSVQGTGKSSAASADPALSVNDTYVSFIDSAVPRNLFALRFESAFDNRQPMRAEYLFPKGGVPGGIGFPFPETRVDSQELTSIAEYSPTSWFSVFIEAPYRWINPEVNANQSGAGDVRYGMKICTWSSDKLIATVLLRLYQPTAAAAPLGTGHWSIEPGLLAAYKISDTWHLEGELRYWTALGGSDFAGDMVRYGLGITWGQRKPAGFWWAPVGECIGWTVLGGKTMIASTPDTFIVQDAHGQTIVNAYLGLRFGYGKNLDFYTGYGRSLTGDAWQRDIYRVEVRLSY